MISRSLITMAVASVTLALAYSCLAGESWARYDNGRFAYSIDIPPGFSAVVEAENSDGGVATDQAGGAKLLVWGSHILDHSFAAEIDERIAQDKNDGWTISYESKKKQAASWSGSKSGQVFYQRAVVGCDGAGNYFRLEYGQRKIKAYNAIISRLVKSLHSAC